MFSAKAFPGSSSFNRSFTHHCRIANEVGWSYLFNMHLSELDLSGLHFRSSAEVFNELKSACDTNPDLAQFKVIGQSEQGRPIAGVTLGYGPRLVTLIAGAHADEPVGPETLRTFVLEGLAARDWLAEGEGLHALFEQFTFRIIPHINPDGEARNLLWIEQWPDPGAGPVQVLAAYLAHRVRELPGDDIEFGYPEMRAENQAASQFLFDGEPISLHMSLHGMGFSEGALLLIEKHWGGEAAELKASFEKAASEAGLRLHDHDRSGVKGFRYYGPGFWSTPEGRAMRAHFEDINDDETAAKFFLSSMEMAVQTGPDPKTGRTPLSLVTELPLFVLDAEYDHEPGVPGLLNQFKEKLPELTLAAKNGKGMAEHAKPYGLRPLGLETAVRLQLQTIEMGLEATR